MLDPIRQAELERKLDALGEDAVRANLRAYAGDKRAFVGQWLMRLERARSSSATASHLEAANTQASAAVSQADAAASQARSARETNRIANRALAIAAASMIIAAIGMMISIISYFSRH